MPKISIVIPCYYNEENIAVTTAELIRLEPSFDSDVSIEYVMVDDGSKDNTYGELLKFHLKYPDRVRIVKLARNFGAQYACLAGMRYATGDCIAILTADLQDPPELIPQMYEIWKQGTKLVIGNRAGRDESLLQRAFSNSFHWLMRRFAIHNVPKGGFDLVLFDRQIKDIIVDLDENNTNWVYMLVWLGYEFVSIPYVRRKREIGRSRWTFSKKVKLFIDSFVAFSFVPIRMIVLIGFLLGFAAFAYGAAIIYSKIFGTVPMEGWSSLMVVILFVSSFQMISLGILGEYLWRSLDAARHRPNYVVEKLVGVLPPARIEESVRYPGGRAEHHRVGMAENVRGGDFET